MPNQPEAGSSPQPPVIFVPGIKGTGLEDYYPVPPETVWATVLPRSYERLSMHPDATRYEATEPARVQASGIFTIVYEDLVEALRHELSPNRNEPTPVFALPYDWRQDCRFSADLLAEFINEVRIRTLLLPHYRGHFPGHEGRKWESAPLQVDLIGHSMGGLIIADYLRRYGQEKKVRRVVTIGAPFEGAMEALTMMTKGTGKFSMETSRERDREAARTLPAVYQLLPTYRGAWEDHPTRPDPLFDPANWQPSVLATLDSYIILHQAAITAPELFKLYLDAVRTFREGTRGLSLDPVLENGSKSWLAIVGVNADTVVGYRMLLDQGALWFEYADEVNDWPRDPDSPRTGDGTVPFLGACPSFLDRSQLVCVSPDDFSRWEFQDRTLARVAGFHATLPTVNVVQRLAIRFLRDDYTGDVWGRIPPGVTVAQAEASWPAWLLDGTRQQFGKLRKG